MEAWQRGLGWSNKNHGWLASFASQPLSDADASFVSSGGTRKKASNFLRQADTLWRQLEPTDQYRLRASVENADAMPDDADAREDARLLMLLPAGMRGRWRCCITVVAGWCSRF